MKMENTGEMINDEHDIIDIGHEFLRQYYTMLSENPEKVYHFYGINSYFIHGEIKARGHEGIQNAIKNLEFENCKARIFSIIGANADGESLVFQVCGELFKNAIPRRFFQTFLLCSQASKKYYVQNDIFQWVDSAFEGSGAKTVVTPPTVEMDNAISPMDRRLESTDDVVLDKKPYVNGGSPAIIAELDKAAEKNKSEPEGIDTAHNLSVDDQPVVLNQSPQKAPQMDVPEAKEFETTKAPTPQKRVQTPPQHSVSQQPKRHQEPQGKKTWAKAAAGPHHQQQHPPQHQEPRKQQPPTASAQNPPQQHPQPPPETVHSKTQQPPKEKYVDKRHTANYNKSSARNFDRDERVHEPPSEKPQNDQKDSTPPPISRTIYFSMLQKNTPEPRQKDGEDELKEQIMKIAGGVVVNKVQIRGSSFRREVKNALGFIEMNSIEDAQTVYDACKKEGEQSYKLHVEVPEFGFNGEILLCPSKTTSSGVLLSALAPRPYGTYHNRQNYNGGGRNDGPPGQNRDYNGGGPHNQNFYRQGGGYRQSSRGSGGPGYYNNSGNRPPYRNENRGGGPGAGGGRRDVSQGE